MNKPRIGGGIMQFVFIKKKWLFYALAFIVFIISCWYYLSSQSTSTASMEKSNANLEIHMVTGEFSSKTEDGKVIEAYRWDPGTIYVPQDENVTLVIHGVNGSEHPFHIEGTDIKGVVKKGQETVIPIKFKEEGIYRLICDTHGHHGQDIPMIAYIVVD
jgi:heme/copper-type cytochrome/quinol oxidase subunit 2